jgi:hypothetical protein
VIRQPAWVSGVGRDLSPVDDLLFAGERIRALHALQEITGCDLQQAIEEIGQRFEMLVATKPERFTVSLDDYWANFFT